MKYQAVRGMRDLLPEETSLWTLVERVIKGYLQRFGYREIRIPILETTELFARTAGPATDLVQKEMYSFTDRSDGNLTLRPEGTAGCVRAAIERNILPQSARLWYQGPMFRYERPQKGRYRQFEQIGVEAFGWPGSDIDTELLEMSWRIWEELRISGKVKLELNTLGSQTAREHYRTSLNAYFSDHLATLDETSVRQLETNPLRILDSKVPEIRALIDKAPQLSDYLDEQSASQFAALCDDLAALRVPFEVNRRLVRGLDYYSHTVFEWTTNELGAQNAICSGGRYDGLVEMLGGKPTPAIGLAFGLDRVVLLAASVDDNITNAVAEQKLDFYVLPLTDAERTAAVQLAASLRSSLPNAHIICHTGGGKVKVRMKAADRSGASHALLLGADEVANNTVTLKPLRNDSEQELVSIANIANRLSIICNRSKLG